MAPASDKVCFVGNPPFGRQSSLAKKFIKHIASWEKAGVIAFILPKSFKKTSMQKCFPINWHLMECYNLPNDSFVIQGQSHNVPCVFQIWEKREYQRWIPEIAEPKGYKFINNCRSYINT